MAMFESLQFFIVAAALAVPAIILGVLEKSQKLYGGIVSFIFLIFSMGVDLDFKNGFTHEFNLNGALFLLAYLAIEYCVAVGFVRVVKTKGRDEKLYYLFIALALAPLVVNKVGGFVDLKLFAFIGISYMTFKMVQIVIEIYDGLIDEVKGAELFYFLTFFPAILCGPIDRSRRFMEDINGVRSRAEYLNMVGDGLFKICLGLVYKKVLASAMVMIGTQNMYIYGLQLFFDFAGYSLMAVGFSYLFGVKTPDNFNQPFRSIDLKDFWNRWHMTLSFWFRDYLFSRILRRAMRGKWFGGNKLTQASVCFIINMTVMGIWHGLELHFIVYGIYHGVLLAITEVYQKKSKFYKKHKKEKGYRLVSWFVTFNLVMFGFYIFSGQLF